MELFYDDVNHAFWSLMSMVPANTTLSSTRNGAALAFDYPVMVNFFEPQKRVLFDPVRDANPFFHYLEAVWMLSGSRQVKFLSYLVPGMAKYSDDTKVFHGAYGHRWRRHFGKDQLTYVVEELKADPNSRRAVIGMWDPSADIDAVEGGGRDVPCNTNIYFRASGKTLNMMVCNRSNDLVMGMLGANVVHMSILLEYIAGALGLEIGRYTQVTNNLHVYVEHKDKYGEEVTWYDENDVERINFSPFTLDRDEAEHFVNSGGVGSYRSPILNRNAAPMLEAYSAYRHKKFDAALKICDNIYDTDWREACTQWMTRRSAKS